MQKKGNDQSHEHVWAQAAGNCRQKHEHEKNLLLHGWRWPVPPHERYGSSLTLCIKCWALNLSSIVPYTFNLSSIMKEIQENKWAPISMRQWQHPLRAMLSYDPIFYGLPLLYHSTQPSFLGPMFSFSFFVYNVCCQVISCLQKLGFVCLCGD